MKDDILACVTCTQSWTQLEMVTMATAFDLGLLFPLVPATNIRTFGPSPAEIATCSFMIRTHTVVRDAEFVIRIGIILFSETFLIRTHSNC